MPSKPLKPQMFPDYFGWIDALRGFAAISVVIFHYTHFYMADAAARPIQVALTDIPYSAYLWPFYQFGEVAVRLFWVISGFVFAHVYWQRDTMAREFAVARFARLYPLHFATLVLVALLQTISLKSTGHWQVFENNDLRHFALQVFMMDHGLNMSNGLSFNGPIWSVSSEILVYLLFFATLPFTKSRPLVASAFLSIAAFGVLSIRPETFPVSQWVFICGVFFFAGSAIFALYRVLNGLTSRLLPTILILVTLAWVAFKLGSTNAMLLSACCVIVLALATLENHASGKAKVVRFFGDISFSIYLVHIPIQIAVLIVADLLFAGSRNFAGHGAALPAYLIASIGIAYLTNRYFEMPVAQWLRRNLNDASKRQNPPVL